MARMVFTILPPFLLALTACAATGTDGVVVPFDPDSATVADAPADVLGNLPADVPPDASPPPACLAGDWGPYGIGARTMTLADPARGDRPLPLVVYYPSTAHPDLAACTQAFDDADPYERFLLPTACATPDADADRSGVPWPVVVFSHGMGSQKEGHKYVLEYLASHGFLVVAIDHTGNVGVGELMPADHLETLTRELDVRFVIDRLIAAFAAADGPLAGLGDPARIGLSGHSWGGHSTIAIAGMRYDWETLQATCDAGQQPDEYYCPLLDHRAEIDAVPDPRVRAAVTYAHDAGHQMAGPQCRGGAGVTIPLMQLLGDQDAFVSVQADGWDCHAAARGPACIVVLHGAGHLGFTDLGDDGQFGADRMHRLVRARTAAFFARHLAGRTACDAILADPGDAAGATASGTFEAACKPAGK